MMLFSTAFLLTIILSTIDIVQNVSILKNDEVEHKTINPTLSITGEQVGTGEEVETSVEQESSFPSSILSIVRTEGVPLQGSMTTAQGALSELPNEQGGGPPDTKPSPCEPMKTNEKKCNANKKCYWPKGEEKEECRDKRSPCDGQDESATCSQAGNCRYKQDGSEAYCMPNCDKGKCFDHKTGNCRTPKEETTAEKVSNTGGYCETICPELQCWDDAKSKRYCRAPADPETRDVRIGYCIKKGTGGTR